MTGYSPGSKSTGSLPRFAFKRASLAIASASMAASCHPVLCAQPDELSPMITVDASVIVDSCSANTPREFATPIRKLDVVIEPAAEHEAAPALRQITAMRRAR